MHERAPHLVADPWLSELMGKPAWHLMGDQQRLLETQAELQSTIVGKDHFVDVKVAAGNTAAVHHVERLGFRLIDTNLRLEMPRSSAARVDSPAMKSATVGFADSQDAAALAAIAERSFVYDRFHRDPAIDESVANAIKRTWVENFFRGKRGEWMVVATVRGKPAGFLQALRSARDELVIDLIAVDQAQRGGGLAKAMIVFADRHCDCAGALVVGTQVANVPSVRLYERVGFRLASAQYVFHHHGNNACA